MASKWAFLWKVWDGRGLDTMGAYVAAPAACQTMARLHAYGWVRAARPGLRVESAVVPLDAAPAWRFPAIARPLRVTDSGAVVLFTRHLLGTGLLSTRTRLARGFDGRRLEQHVVEHREWCAMDTRLVYAVHAPEWVWPNAIVTE